MTEDFENLSKEELINECRRLSIKFEKVANEYLQLTHYFNCSLGTLKMFLDTTKTEVPFPYKMVENELLF